MNPTLKSLLVTVIALMSCAPQESVQRPEIVKPRQSNDTLVRRLDSDVSSLNPVLAAKDVDRQVGKYLYTPLIYLDKNLEPMPGLATSWDVSTDGRTYRFVLDKRATFSDPAKTPVRAHDVVFTLNKIVEDHSGALQLAGAFSGLDVKRTRAISDSVVEVAFHSPLATQLSRFADLYVVPEKIYGVGNFRETSNTIAIGSGPYRLERYEARKQIVLERREDYWNTPPPIKRVIFRVIEDRDTAWSALVRGDIDETTISSETWVRHRNDPALRDRISFHYFYTFNYSFITWNCRHPILRDVRVRRALAKAIPIDDAIERLYHNTARVVTGPFTPDQEEYSPDVPRIAFDPAAAKRELAAAGWLDHDGDGDLDKGGRDLTIPLQIIARAGMEPFAQLVQSSLRQIGVLVEIEVFDSATAFERVYTGNYGAAFLAWNLDAEPDLFGFFHSSQFPKDGQNISFYQNSEADRLIEQAREALDGPTRRKMYRRLHAMLAADQPYAWTVQVATKWATNKRLRGVEFSRGDGPLLWYPGEFSWSLD